MLSFIARFRKQAYTLSITFLLLAGIEAFSQSQPIRIMSVGHYKQATTGINYYQLRKVDFDGTESLSPVLAASPQQAAAEEMRVYPTRTQSNKQVKVQMLALQPQEKFSIAIYTLEGRLVKEFEAEADNRGNFVQLLSTSGLGDGNMYMVRATLPGRAFIRHLTIDR